ncbi:hypothetical protein HY838_01485 [Candidatus Azambacteria bacterium]|nr:hypothetical protein [Candidatus Azambacteria bacterium]
MTKKYQKWASPILIGILILLVIGAYVKVFRAEFVYDDFGFIVNNKAIQSFSPFSKFFTDPNIFTGSNIAAETGGKNWRPVASLAFAVEYALFGANPAGFHFVSIFLHILNLALVYVLIVKLVKRRSIAALAAAFWALHPAATEAVSWVSNQSSLIFLGFFILAVLAILNYQENGNKKYLLRISYLFFALALLTKETALGGVFIIPFIFLINYREREVIDFRRIFKDFYPFAIIGLAYFYAHYKILGALGDHALRGSFFQNILLAPAVFLKYVGLVVYPVKLLLDYASFPLPSGIGDLRVIFGFLFAVILAALAYFGFKKSRFIFTLGIVWFAAFLLPVLQIIPFHDLVGERFLYAPLAGFFLALILGFDYLFAHVKSKFDWNLYPAGKTISALVLISFFVLTFNRNNDWLNSENLWNSVLRIDPKNEKALVNLEAVYQNTGRYEKALEIAQKLNARLNSYPYIEDEFRAPAVEGNIINSGIAGRIVLNGEPYEASFEIFKSGNLTAPFISARAHSDGTFQIPLRPDSYVFKPLDPDGPIAPARTEYPFAVGDGRWLQIKIEYK